LRTYSLELDGREELRDAVRSGGADPLASWMVLDSAGRLLAVSHGEGVRDPRLAGRDYFHGAMAGARPGGRPFIHVSRAYLSQNQRIYKFGITAAVRDPSANGAILGVVGVTLATGATLGPRLVDGDQRAVLALPADDYPPHEPRVAPMLPAEYLIVVHPAYRPRQAPLRMPGGLLPPRIRRPGGELQLTHGDDTLPPLDDYRDPAAQLDPSYAGRWLAGFAPVGNTEFVVIVQEPYRAVTAPDGVLLRQLSMWLGVTLVLGAAATTVLVVLRLRAVRSHVVQAARL
jgi:hypothetical protein